MLYYFKVKDSVFLEIRINCVQYKYKQTKEAGQRQEKAPEDAIANAHTKGVIRNTVIAWI